MCELFGISTKNGVDVREYLKRFYSHSVHHPHGWGLMRYNDGKEEIIKEARSAIGSRILTGSIESTKPQTALLAHIRLATVGGMKYDNCHPYSGFDLSGRRWTLIHNGTMYSGIQLLKYLGEQLGDTDSERVYLYLIDEINDEIVRNDAPLSAEQRFRVINRAVSGLAPRNKLNLMIYDGELLYVHKNMKDTLMYLHTDQGYIFSTKALDDKKWEQYPMTQVNAFRNGELVFSGENHGNEFIPTLEYITAMDAMNI